MVEISQFSRELAELSWRLRRARHVLLTAPAVADGDSVGSQLALRSMFAHAYPHLRVTILNDEPIPPRYAFLPGVESIVTPEQVPNPPSFDLAIAVDGGIDRAGRVQPIYEDCPVRVFIDHHQISADFPYCLRFVDATACSTTELIYHLSQTEYFRTPLTPEFSQCIYLGLVFDTGFFRHANTTPEAMELGAKLLRCGFDFTRVGERGMLERTFASLQLLAYAISRAQRSGDGRVIWSSLTLRDLADFNAGPDDREGIIDHFVLTNGVAVALLFFELSPEETKVSLRSQGIDVAYFARSLGPCGGGHPKAAGANLELPIDDAIPYVVGRLEKWMADAVRDTGGWKSCSSSF